MDINMNKEKEKNNRDCLIKLDENINFDKFKGTYVPADLMRNYKDIQKQILDGDNEKDIENSIRNNLQKYAPRKSGRPLESKVNEYKTELVRKSKIYNAATAFLNVNRMFQERGRKYLCTGNKDVVWWIKNSLPHKAGGVFAVDQSSLANMGIISLRLFNASSINRNNICYFSRVDSSYKKSLSQTDGFASLVASNPPYNTGFSMLEIMDWMFSNPEYPECYPLNGKLYWAIVKDAIQIAKENPDFALSEKILENGPLILNDIKNNPYKYTRIGFKDFWETRLSMKTPEDEIEEEVRKILDERIKDVSHMADKVNIREETQEEKINRINKSLESMASKIDGIQNTVNSMSRDISAINVHITEISELNILFKKHRSMDSPKQISLFSFDEIQSIVKDSESEKETERDYLYSSMEM